MEKGINKWEDLEKVILNDSDFADKNLFIPGEETKNLFMEYSRVLVVGAGGLGCEILKNLSLSGFSEIHVIDMDKIDLTNLNRQFLFRHKDIGRFKSEVAAEFILKRVSHREKNFLVKAHVGKIQDFSKDFFKQFHVIIAGLDNIEARRWLNLLVHSLIERDENNQILEESVKYLVDGGTEGLRGQARVIIPYKTACFECTLDTLPKQTKYNLCTISETPRLPEHCISYAYLIEWEKHFGKDKKIDTDSFEDMNWIFETASKRADNFGIAGVNYMLTMGVVKNIIPAVASTNALIAASCCNEAFKIVTGCSKIMNDYFMFMGQTGINTNTFSIEKKNDCLVCSQKH